MKRTLLRLFGTIALLATVLGTAAITTSATAVTTATFSASRDVVAGACTEAGGILTGTGAEYGCAKPNCDGEGGDCVVACVDGDPCLGSSPDTCGPLTFRQFFGLVTFERCPRTELPAVPMSLIEPNNDPVPPPPPVDPPIPN